ncbi:MAG TPA: GxxExxY protein [Pyrinomonadaceae bacterium]|nr:GxxExxY protein [Pyrinomonadaceae bacterium]
MEIDVLTRTIIGCAYKVHNALGAGFLERVYENALQIELSKVGIIAKQQELISVWYDGHVVGDYQPDLWIAEQLIVEVKAVQTLLKEHEVKLVHYLTATHVDNGLLINFGPSVQVKRKFREYRVKASSNPVVWNS